MSSPQNDRLRLRTALGSVNYYNQHMCMGTSREKAYAARSGGHNYDPISNESVTYLPHLRTNEHYIDDNNKLTRMSLEV